MKTIRDFNFQDKRVLMRADLDVPIADGNVVDDFRLKKAVLTMKHVLSNCKQLIIMGHVGRPGGKPDLNFTAKPIVEKLEELLSEKVTFVSDCIQEKLPEDKIILLENLRFHKEERENNEEFAKKLASYADIYVNESFGNDHRKHASIVGVPKFITGCIGFQVEKELKYLKLENPERPYVAIIAGVKLETKIPVIKNLLEKVDYVLVGGAMIFNFYKAKGLEVGKSIYQKEYVDEAKKFLDNPKLILPTDVIVASSPDDESKVVSVENIPSDMKGLDIGPESIEKFKEILSKAKTIIWNGPLGYYEKEPFDKATKELANFIANLECTTIVGGGDTVSVIDKLGLMDKFTHVSTGGGSSLVLLEGKQLEALKALE